MADPVELYKAMANWLIANRPDVYEEICKEYGNIADGLIELEKINHDIIAL